MDLVKGINDFYYRMALCELQVMNGADAFEGLSYNSMLYANVIAMTDRCTASKLAEALGITKSAVAVKVGELVARGVVVRTQSEEDKRVFYLTLSPETERALGLYDAVFSKIDAQLRARYDEAALDAFGEVLSTIASFDWRRVLYGCDTRP